MTDKDRLAALPMSSDELAMLRRSTITNTVILRLLATIDASVTLAPQPAKRLDMGRCWIEHSHDGTEGHCVYTFAQPAHDAQRTAKEPQTLAVQPDPDALRVAAQAVWPAFVRAFPSWDGECEHGFQPARDCPNQCNDKTWDATLAALLAALGAHR